MNVKKNPPVILGSTRLVESEIGRYSGASVGLIGNHTSVLNNGQSTLTALLGQRSVVVKRLFSPEHGAAGRYDDLVGDESDPATGLQIFSLYGKNKKPSQEMLTELDLLFFELQDVGARFYTYASTMMLAIDAAYEAGVKVIVLDRPNPIGGIICEGSIADTISFTSAHHIPIRHGLTLGELALLYAAETGKESAVEVVACQNLDRESWFDRTGVPWISPSPAMRSLDTATVYPGVCLLEQTNVSVGRGTEAPFEIVGAPWIDEQQWFTALDRHIQHGVEIAPLDFTPFASKYAGERCRGIRIHVIDRSVFQPVSFGLLLASTLWTLYPASFDLPAMRTLLASESTFQLLNQNCDVQKIVAGFENDLSSWMRRRQAYLLYERKMETDRI